MKPKNFLLGIHMKCCDITTFFSVSKLNSKSSKFLKISKYFFSKNLLKDCNSSNFSSTDCFVETFSNGNNSPIKILNSEKRGLRVRDPFVIFSEGRTNAIIETSKEFKTQKSNLFYSKRIFKKISFYLVCFQTKILKTSLSLKLENAKPLKKWKNSFNSINFSILKILTSNKFHQLKLLSQNRSFKLFLNFSINIQKLLKKKLFNRKLKQNFFLIFVKIVFKKSLNVLNLLIYKYQILEIQNSRPISATSEGQNTLLMGEALAFPEGEATRRERRGWTKPNYLFYQRFASPSGKARHNLLLERSKIHNSISKKYKFLKKGSKIFGVLKKKILINCSTRTRSIRPSVCFADLDHSKLISLLSSRPKQVLFQNKTQFLSDCLYTSLRCLKFYNLRQKFILFKQKHFLINNLSLIYSFFSVISFLFLNKFKKVNFKNKKNLKFFNEKEFFIKKQKISFLNVKFHFLTILLNLESKRCSFSRSERHFSEESYPSGSYATPYPRGEVAYAPVAQNLKSSRIFAFPEWEATRRGIAEIKERLLRVEHSHVGEFKVLKSSSSFSNRLFTNYLIKQLMYFKKTTGCVLKSYKKFLEIQFLKEQKAPLQQKEEEHSSFSGFKNSLRKNFKKPIRIGNFEKKLKSLTTYFFLEKFINNYFKTKNSLIFFNLKNNEFFYFLSNFETSFLSFKFSLLTSFKPKLSNSLLLKQNFLGKYPIKKCHYNYLIKQKSNNINVNKKFLETNGFNKNASDFQFWILKQKFLFNHTIQAKNMDRSTRNTLDPNLTKMVAFSKKDATHRGKARIYLFKKHLFYEKFLKIFKKSFFDFVVIKSFQNFEYSSIKKLEQYKIFLFSFEDLKMLNQTKKYQLKLSKKKFISIFQLFFLIKTTLFEMCFSTIFIFNKNSTILTKTRSFFEIWLSSFFGVFPSGIQLLFQGSRRDVKSMIEREFLPLQYFKNQFLLKINFKSFFCLFYYLSSHFSDRKILICKFYNLFFKKTKKNSCFSNQIQSSSFLNQKHSNVILLPPYNNLKKHLQILKNITKKTGSKTQFTLMQNLSFKIVEWCYFYRIASNFQIYYYCDNILFRLLWKWAKKTHPNKSQKWIQKKYFFSLGFQRNPGMHDLQPKVVTHAYPEQKVFSSILTNRFSYGDSKKTWLFKFLLKNNFSKIKFQTKLVSFEICYLPLHSFAPLSFE